MAEFNYQALGKATEALKRGVPVRITLNNGDIYPHEVITNIDGGPYTFFFRCSAECAAMPPQLGLKAGDVTGLTFEDVARIDLLEEE